MKDESRPLAMIPEETMRNRDLKLQQKFKEKTPLYQGHLVNGKLSDYIRSIEKHCNLIEVDGDL